MGLELPVMVMASVTLAGVQVALKLVAVEPVLAAVKFTLATVLPAETLAMVGAKGAVAVVSVVVLEPEVDAVTVTELVATLLLPSVMVMVAT
jgi:hypothetical protein